MQPQYTIPKILNDNSNVKKKKLILQAEDIKDDCIELKLMQLQKYNVQNPVRKLRSLSDIY